MSATTVGNVTNIGSVYNWEIQCFGSLPASVGTAIYSPVFSTKRPSGKTLKWRLKLYPNGQHENSAGYLSVYLQTMNDFQLSTLLSISVVADSDIEVFKQKTYSAKDMQYQSCWGWSQYQKRVYFTDKNIRALLNDTLTLCCSIHSTEIPESVVQTFREDENSKVIDYFENLLETGVYSDVTFFIGEQSLKLHKAILGSLSSVFYSKFNNNGYQINYVKQVKINTKISFEVMKEMFRYIYARKVNNIKEIAIDLYAVADKYKIEGLKALCDETLYRDLNTDNALSLLELAVKYDMVKLKPLVTDFVVKELKLFLRKEQFKQLSSDCKDLLLNLAAGIEDEL